MPNSRATGLKISNVDVYSPSPLGRCDVYVFDKKILSIGNETPDIPGVEFRTLDGTGLVMVPGFIDSHLHFTGAGSIGAGPVSREPDFSFSEIVSYGITTAVGCPGADYLSRSMINLFQKARSLESEGLSTYFWSSGYSNPSITLTQSLSTDMLICEKALGAKIAISDYMAPPWTADELHRLLWQVISGSQMAAKKGVVHVHAGVLPAAIDVVKEVVSRYSFQEGAHWSSMHGGGGSVASHFQITHVNWTDRLLKEATDFAIAGGTADVTAGLSPNHGSEGSVIPSEAVIRMLEAGVPDTQITVSSDSGGNISHCHGHGEVDLIRLRPPLILEVFQELARTDSVSLETAAKVTSTNVADLHGWTDKGHLVAGQRADLLLFGADDFDLRHVVLGGDIVFEDSQPVRLGLMESGRGLMGPVHA
ncbi:amidohydrolase family protein [Rhodococcus sp. IEGM 1379]|uniref:amidohydrolase family protein n=1 Tax=Rhodococcus sp. IEGM 1379 TaxID=3047086 RepID=UPI0024B83209|nr:amidohydrolase family protein [Rhodococcus sp. IEGM 1379]MDI9918633.1 amidohydrolase family protein [Rhodococcus sp. IEGM 1379]